MLKRMVSFLLVVGLVCSANSVFAGEQIVFQTSFEFSEYAGIDENAEKPLGWDYIIMSPIQAFVTMEWDKTAAKTGDASLKQTQLSKDSNSAWFHVIEDINGGEVYTFTAWFRSKGVGTGGAGFWIEWKDKDGNLLRNDIPPGLINTDDEWQRWALSLVAPEGAGKATFILRHNNLNGTVWYDDLAVYKGQLKDAILGEMSRIDD